MERKRVGNLCHTFFVGAVSFDPAVAFEMCSYGTLVFSLRAWKTAIYSASEKPAIFSKGSNLKSFAKRRGSFVRS